MRIALIDPPGINKGLNVGLSMLSACLGIKGYEVKIFDFNNNADSLAERIFHIRQYDLIGFSIKTFTLRNSLEIARALRREDLFCGGPHVTLDGINLLKDSKYFKIGVIGEGEDAIGEIADTIRNNLALSNIRGIVYRQANEIITTASRNFPDDLDALPLSDYSAFDSVKKGIRDYPVITSRGCPYSCIYCCVGRVSGKAMRFRNISNVIREIRNAKKIYHSQSFQILDDNFTFDVDRAKDFCRLLIKDKTNMPWSCPNGLRADRINEELVALMKESGCRYVSIGIESLDEEVFANTKKGGKLEEIKSAVYLFNKYKIKLNGFFLIGLPKDTLAKTIGSFKKSKEIGVDSAHWNMFVPYPGTEAWEWVNKNAKIVCDWREGFHFGINLKPVFETNEFKTSQMIRAYQTVNIKSKNYSAFFNGERPVIINAFVIFLHILRYDATHIFEHLCYVIYNLSAVKKHIIK